MTAAEIALVADAVREIIESAGASDLSGAARADAASAIDGIDRPLWAALSEAGMTRIGVDIESGGSGGSLREAAAAVSTLARFACRVPVAEHMIVACWALSAAGLGLPDSSAPVTFSHCGSVRLATDGQGGKLTGQARRVPWASDAGYLVVVAATDAGHALCLVPTSATTVQLGSNLAGEPRCGVTFDGLDLPVGAIVPLEAAQLDELRVRYALARAIQMSAALEQVLDWTLQYSSERIQFGRPLNKFQTVQSEIARMAGEVASVAALVDGALERSLAGGDFSVAAAAANVRASMAVRVVARAAHQIHGAIGFTLEYRLHRLTTRLWSWRDEAGSEAEWAAYVGAQCLGRGGAGLWPAITDML